MRLELALKLRSAKDKLLRNAQQFVAGLPTMYR